MCAVTQVKDPHRSPGIHRVQSMRVQHHTMADRVCSKNIFNFRPQGFIDEDIVAFDEKMKADFGLDPEKMEAAMIGQTNTEFAAGMRAMMDGTLVQSSFGLGAPYVEVKLKFYEMPNERGLSRRTQPATTLSWRWPPATTASTTSRCWCTRPR